MLKKFLKKFRLVRMMLYYLKPGYNNIHVFGFLNKKSIFIDIGSNIGDISSYVNDFCRSKIYCYEPHPGAFKALKKRFYDNKNINIFNVAVSNKTTNTEIFFHKNTGNFDELEYSEATSLDSKKSNIDISKKIKINTIHIKEILNKFPIIDCIKIDIEGHEYEILPYIFKNKKKIKKVVCELHGNQKLKKSNIHLAEKYQEIKKYIYENNLSNWFIEWN